MICLSVQSLSSSLCGPLKQPNPSVDQLFEVIYCHFGIRLKMQFIQKQPFCHGRFYASIWSLWLHFFFIIPKYLFFEPCLFFQSKRLQPLKMCFELAFYIS